MSKRKHGFWSVLSALWHAVGTARRKFWRWYKKLYKGKRWYTKTAIAFCSFIVCFFLYLGAVDINFLWLFGKSPSMKDIMDPKTPTASFIYSADGQLIGKYFNENRTPVKYSEVNPVFFTALVDTEDERFYDHMGIDFQGLFAALKDYLVHHQARGASTITQQLVKNMFRVRTKYSTGLLGYIPGVKMVIMKTKEWILATEIEIFYHDKQRILEMYANTVDFGNNAYGIKTAAKTYFNTTPDKLTTEQAALLVGVLKGTTVYNPKRNPERSLKRRNVVLNNMVTHRHLSKEEYAKLSALPIGLEFAPENEMTGVGPYFRQAVIDELADWCDEQGYDLYTDGLEIHTTIDTRLQKYAEQAVKEKMREVQSNFNSTWGDRPCWVDENGNEIPGFVHDVAEKSDVYKALLTKYNGNIDSVEAAMNRPRKMHIWNYDGGEDVEMSPMDSIRRMLHFMHCGFIAMEPETGHVKAWVGDVDYKTWKFDKVNNPHQPGSTFKIFVYSAAMEQGLTPCDRRPDQYIDTLIPNKQTGVLERWTPHNASGRCSGANMTLRSAFAQSINLVAIRVGNEVGLQHVAQTAHLMGIKSPLEGEKPGDSGYRPSQCLGTDDVTLRELVGAYSTVVNDGMQRDPVLVTSIFHTEKDGSKKEIYNADKIHGKPTRAISKRAAYFMTKMLMAGVTDAGGTSQGLNSYIPCNDTDFGGKTGTSNSHADGWFVGVTPRLVCGAWVGGEYRQIHFQGRDGQGSHTALPICGAFMRRVFGDRTFSKYHAHFPNDASLDRFAMTCSDDVVEELDSAFMWSDSVDFSGWDQWVDDDINQGINGHNPAQGSDEVENPENPAAKPAENPEQESVDRVKQAFSRERTAGYDRNGHDTRNVPPPTSRQQRQPTRQ